MRTMQSPLCKPAAKAGESEKPKKIKLKICNLLFTAASNKSSNVISVALQWSVREITHFLPRCTPALDKNRSQWNQSRVDSASPPSEIQAKLRQSWSSLFDPLIRKFSIYGHAWPFSVWRCSLYSPCANPSRERLCSPEESTSGQTDCHANSTELEKGTKHTSQKCWQAKRIQFVRLYFLVVWKERTHLRLLRLCSLRGGRLSPITSMCFFLPTSSPRR